MTSLSFSNVRKLFGDVPVIHGIDLNIEAGEFVVFVGPSGCGKSTLLRMIAGLEEISDGEINIGGRSVNKVEPAERGVAMVFQSYALYPHMTVRRNLGFGLRMNGIPKRQVEAKVADIMKTLRLDGLAGRKPKQLSGGQRQRVAIGRALVRSPRIFLFDEPLSNLDAELRVKMRVEISELHSQLGITTVYVTHDQVEAMTLADRIVVLNAGRVEQVGRPLELYENPDNLFVAGFIGSPRINLFPVRVLAVDRSETVLALPSGAKLPVPLANDSAAPGQEFTLGVRPEHFQISDAPDGLEMRIIHSEHLGNISYIHGATPDGQQVIVEDRDARWPASGSVRLECDPTRVHLFDSRDQRVR